MIKEEIFHSLEGIVNDIVYQLQDVKVIMLFGSYAMCLQTNKIFLWLLACLLMASSAVSGQESQNPTGTGFVVDANGYLLTCQHVVKDAEKMEVGHAAGLSVLSRTCGFACQLRPRQAGGMSYLEQAGSLWY